ncbi:MAG: hypothetical protein J5598_01685 [Clostridia bacterium]|nr:hypothetical protein [Clostridia bacterium]
MSGTTLENVDIVFDAERADFAAEKTDKYKGENICNVQLGSLNGGKSIGIDFDQFVRGQLEFSVATFKAHVIQQLTALNCTVKSVDIQQNELDGTITIGVR